MKISEGELFNNTNLEISQAPHHGARLLRERRDLDEARQLRRVRRGQRRGHRAADRHVPDRRRLLVASRTSSRRRRSRRTTCSAAARRSRCRRSCRSLRQLFLLRFVEPYFLDTFWTFAFDLYNQSRYFATSVVGATAFARNATGGTLTWGYPLSATRRARSSPTSSKTSVITSGHGRLREPRRDVDAGRGAAGREPVPRRLHVVAQGLAVVGLAKQPLVPDAAAGTTPSSSSTRASTPARRTSSSATAASSATTADLWGPFVLHLQRRGRRDDLDRSARRADQRALPGRRHLQHPRLRAAARSVRACWSRSPATSASRSGSLPLGGNMQIIFNSEVEFPLFKKVGISGVVFFDMGNAYNLESRYCSGLAAQELGDADPVRPVLPVAGVVDGGHPQARSASASAGSRRSARCASSGASRSTRSSVKIRLISSSRSVTSSRDVCADSRHSGSWASG